MGFEGAFDGVGGKGVEGWGEVGCGVERVLVGVAGVGVGYFLECVSENCFLLFFLLDSFLVVDGGLP